MIKEQRKTAVKSSKEWNILDDEMFRKVLLSKMNKLISYYEETVREN